MEWTPSDIALVVSSAGTASAAVFGVAIPVWMRAVDKRTTRRETRYAKAAEAVYFCIENIEHVLQHKMNQRMRLAFLQKNLPIMDLDKDDQAVEREFDRRRRIAQLLAQEAGVDFSAFELQLLTAISAVSTFTIVDGELVEADGSMERMTKRHRAVEQFVKEGAKLLDAFRKSFGLN